MKRPSLYLRRWSGKPRVTPNGDLVLVTIFLWRNNKNLGTALLLFNRRRKPPGCKYEGNKFFWVIMPRQLENTNVSKNTTASIFIGLAVQALKIETTWCPKHSNYRIVDTATYLRNLFLTSKNYENSNLASKYKRFVLFTTTIFYSIVSISLEVNSNCLCIFIS
jgi:hypothetical protein